MAQQLRVLRASTEDSSSGPRNYTMLLRSLHLIPRGWPHSFLYKTLQLIAHLNIVSVSLFLCHSLSLSSLYHFPSPPPLPSLSPSLGLVILGFFACFFFFFPLIWNCKLSCEDLCLVQSSQERLPCEAYGDKCRDAQQVIIWKESLIWRSL